MDHVRTTLLKEGREARNICAFNIPVNDCSKIAKSDKPPCGLKPSKLSSSSSLTALGATSVNQTGVSSASTAASATVTDLALSSSNSGRDVRVLAISTVLDAKKPPFIRTKQAIKTSHLRSLSVGRDKPSFLRARYWSFLFGNLKRSIEEIYTTVEFHENMAECQEVTLVLENYIRDFQALSKWLRLKWEFENTPALERPTSVTWDISKTSSRHSSSVSTNSSSGKTSPNVILPVISSTNSIAVLPAPASLVAEHSDIKETSEVEAERAETTEEAAVKRQFSDESVSVGSLEQKITTTEECSVVKSFDETESHSENESPCPVNGKAKTKIRLPSMSEAGKQKRITTAPLKLIEPKRLDSCDISDYGPRPSDELESHQNVRKPHLKVSEIGVNTDPIDESLVRKSLSWILRAERRKFEEEEKKKDHNKQDESKSEKNCLEVVSAKLEPLKENAALQQVESKSEQEQEQEAEPKSEQRLTTNKETEVEEVNTTITRKSSTRSQTNAAQSETITGNKENIRSSTNVPIKTKQPEVKRTESKKPKIKQVHSMGLSKNLKSITTSASVEEEVLETVGGKTSIVPVKVTKMTTATIATITPSVAMTTATTTTTTQKTLTGRATFAKTVANSMARKPIASKPDLIKLVASSGSSSLLAVTKSTSSVNWNSRQQYSNRTASELKEVPKDRAVQKPSPVSDVDGWLTVRGKSRQSRHNRKSDSGIDWTNRFNEVSATTSLPVLSQLRETVVTGSELARIKSKEDLKKDTEKKLEQEERSLQEQIAALRSTQIAAADIDSEEVDDILQNQTKVTKTMAKAMTTTHTVARTVARGVTMEVMPAKLMNVSALRTTASVTTTRTKAAGMAIAQTTTTKTKFATTGTMTTEQQELRRLSLEDLYEPMLTNMSHDERFQALSILKTIEARFPGRALKLHEKLSSPSRKQQLSLSEVLRQYEQKQERAELKRQQLLQEKSNKLQSLLARVEEVKTARTNLIEEKRRTMEQRLERATENRNQHLKSIVRKAHDEEEKMREIAFINQLEAKNKMHDFLSQCREEKKRLQEIQDDRRKKQQEKAEREAKIEQRKKDLERAKIERLNRLKTERRQKDERIEQQQQQRERERQKLAREKARDREERISAIQAQHLENMQKLQRRISQKQKDSALRYEENMEQIKQKAFESSILRSHVDDEKAPANDPYPKLKFCKVCNITINSEVYLLSHLRSKKHQEIAKKNIKENDTTNAVVDQIGQFNLKQIVDCPTDAIDPKAVVAKERAKLYKKRCKKIRQRLIAHGATFEANADVKFTETEQKRVLLRLVNSVLSLVNQSMQGFSPNTSLSLERKINELCKLISSFNSEIGNFRISGGFNVLGKLLNVANSNFDNSPISQKSLESICKLWIMACDQSSLGRENCKYIIQTNRIISLIDNLNNRLQILDTNTGDPMKVPSDFLAAKLMEIIATILNNTTSDTSQCQLQDIISYAVCVGLIERLSKCCICIRGAFEPNNAIEDFLLNTLDFLAAVAAKCPTPMTETPATMTTMVVSKAAPVTATSVALPIPSTDPTLLIQALHSTELLGIVSMLYSTLMLSTKSLKLSATSNISNCLSLAISTFRLLARIAELDLYKFQDALGAEGISLQFRHIASYLLTYCSKLDSPNSEVRRQILHEIIHVVGYFAVNNKDNQMLLVSGYAPSVLQQLCTLPFPYFSVQTLSDRLYPTLLACSYNNPDTTKIVNNELCYETLETFRCSEAGKSIKLVQLLAATATGGISPSNL